MKKHYGFASLILGLFFLVPVLRVSGQLSRGGVPPSTLYSIPADEAGLLTIDPPPAGQLLIEDEESPSPYRFGVLLPADIGPEINGKWADLPGGDRIWRAPVQVPGALAVSLYFDRFAIPEGGSLFVYNEDKSQVIGAYTNINNSSKGYFATELVKGDRVTLEYFQSHANRQKPVIHCNGIGYAYRGVEYLYPEGVPDLSAGACEVNVKCMEGDNWRDQVRGVVRIQVRRGFNLFWCSGSVVNDVPCDHLPYVLTADHCGLNATPDNILQWIFYFNFESPYCPNPPTPPVPNSMTGAVMKAHGGNGGDTGSDFFLVLLNESIPDSFNVYYNGWNRKDTTSPNGVGIHHPQGDIKKISTYKTKLISSTWSGGSVYSHWKVVWSATVNGHGVTEGGSSGSPIFDNMGRIVGTLTGGQSSCDSTSLNLPDYYGKFSYSWASNGTSDTTRLMPWLDPDGTGLWTLDGTALTIPPSPGGNFNITVYPNPFEGVINLRTDRHINGTIHISLVNLLGISCFAEDENLQPGEILTIDPGDIPDGIYILRISNGKNFKTQKIIRQTR